MRKLRELKFHAFIEKPRNNIILKLFNLLHIFWESKEHNVKSSRTCLLSDETYNLVLENTIAQVVVVSCWTFGLKLDDLFLIQITI